MAPSVPMLIGRPQQRRQLIAGKVTSRPGESNGASGSPTKSVDDASLPRSVLVGGTPATTASLDGDEVLTMTMEDVSISPLKVALEFAQVKLREATNVREALEAEAQEVAQLAIEAIQAKNAAAELVVGLAAEAEPLAAADVKAKLEMAEAAAEKAEAVAAAAMKACEVAVKEEMQAQAVVKETKMALEKAISAISDTNPAALASAVEASINAAVAAASSQDPASTTVAKVEAAVAKSLDGAALLSLASMSDGEPPAEKPNYAQLFAFAGLACLVWWFMTCSPTGQSITYAFGEMIDMIKVQLSKIHIHGPEVALLEAIALLATSIICVPLVVSKIPGGNPVLGYLLGGALVGPYALGIVQDVNNIKHLAEMGVVFLLFNIGLELSIDRLASMAKYVFGMGSLQVIFTLAGVAAFSMGFAGLPAPSAIILGGALAMSTTAVGIQVLEDRGEMGSRHGRAIFSVLLLQDLAVVLLLMLIPLLAPSPDGNSGGMAKIAQALGAAAVKAVVCIFAIIAGGRLLIQPLYKKMSEFANAEIFASTTLLVALGTSFLTQMAGLSLALGAFLAGLLIAETEYALQVESDIAPYKGLLMGLFFMSVGMEISGQLFLAKWKEVIVGITVLIAGKLAVMAMIGPWFGLPKLAAIRAGLLLAPGGEFAFVAFGVAVSQGVLPTGLTNLLYLVVALSMALTPYLAALGGVIGQMMDKGDTKALQPKEEETKELRDHVIIMGYGRSGQLLAQILSENLIPFVALDVSTERVAAGKAHDLPVYFGDAGSPAVLHLLGAERAACAIIALDTPGANYRAVYAMTKHFPGVKTFARAHDVSHGINLEKAGATAVVPEILEPSLQLAAAVLSNMDYQTDEINQIINGFRRKNTSQLMQIASAHQTTIGYGSAVPVAAGAGAVATSSM